MSENKIVILGATSGVAQSVSKLIASADTEFYLVARDAEKLSMVAADLKARGSTVHEIVMDLAELDSHESLFAQIKIANHVFMFHSTLPDQSVLESDWKLAKQSLDVNLLSSLSLLHGFANQLEKQGNGSLVVVTSVAGDRGRASNYWYGTAKGALSIHCQGLRNRLSKVGVNVLTVKPGFIDTAMTSHIPKKPAALWASSDQVAQGIVNGWRKEKNVIYTPVFWRFIMLIITSIPETIFKRLSL